MAKGPGASSGRRLEAVASCAAVRWEPAMLQQKALGAVGGWRRKGRAGHGLGLATACVVGIAPWCFWLAPSHSQILSPAVAPPSAAPYSNPQVQEVVGLVQAAATAVRARGEGAFADFRRRGAPWFQGERYVFVLSTEGKSLVYPPQPSREGTNYLGFEDLGGKRFGRQFVAVAQAPPGRGWVHYQWRRPNPADRRPVWKATYLETVTAPSGQTYLVLSGLYDPPMERAFVLQEVDAAAELLQTQGRAGFEQLRDQRSRFFYQDAYVFVLSAQGQLLVNPAFPALEGRNLLELAEPNEKKNAQASLGSVLARGSVWTTYNWPRPDHTTLRERKTTFLRRVVLPGGETLIVGSGLYADF